VGVARGATFLLADNAVTMMVTVASFTFIARLITREDMGELAVLVLIATGAQLLGRLSVSSAATKFVATFEAMGEHHKKRQVGYECILINAVCTLALALAIYLSANFLASFLLGSQSKAILLKLLVLDIGSLSISESLIGTLLGLKKFQELSVTSVATFVVRQSLVIAFLELGWGLSGIVIGYGIGDFLNSLILAVYTRKFLGPPAIGFGLRRLLKFSAPLLLGDTANFAWTWFDRALLIPLVSLAQLGTYNVAVTAFVILNLMPSSISNALFPYYSHFYPESGEASSTVELENSVRVASRYVSFFTIPLSIGLAVTALPAVTLLAGNGYAGAAVPLAILSVSLGMACLQKALSQIFVVLRKTVTSAIVTVASVSLPILIGIMIVPEFGIIGASVARGISLIISLLLSMLILRKILKLQFDREAYGFAWIASLLMAGTVLAIERFSYSKYLLPVYVAIGAIVFVLTLRLLHAINRGDMELVEGLLGSRMKPLVETIGKLMGVTSETTKEVTSR